jgi:type II secretory pathway component PulF
MNGDTKPAQPEASITSGSDQGGKTPEPGHQPGPGTEPVATVRAAGLSADDLITLNEEIAGMARAGLPLDKGLEVLAREMGRGRLQQVTAQLAADLQAGHPLPEALERQGGRVPPFYAGLVAAGIRTGRISEVLATLTIYTRALIDLRGTVVSALFYPAVVLGVAFTLFGLICFLLVPQFEKFFADFRLRLPAVTEFVLVLGRHPMLYVVTPAVSATGTLLVLRWVLLSTEGGRRTWVRLVYAVPLVGTLIRAARLASFTELLAILVDHSLPLPEAFRLAGEASSDPNMADGARRIEQDLREGLPLGAVLRERGVVPELVAWMTGVGEQRGTLGPTLHQVAELYRRQVEMRAALLRSVLTPFLIIVTAAIVVGLFLFAVMLPLIGLLKGLSGV